MTYRNLSTRRLDRVAYLVLNRPEEGNSIDGPTADELAEFCRKVNQDDQIWVLVLTGAGEVFSVESAGSGLEGVMASKVACAAVASLNVPVVVALNGDAVGSGLELALAGDIRLAVEGARFGLQQVAHGLIPAGGGTQRLPRIVGKGKALEMILTAELADSTEAYRIGLVNRVVAAGRLEGEAAELARKLASKGPIASRYAKEAIIKGLDMTLGQGLGLESDISIVLQSTADRDEGIRAFLEKRSAEFTGR